jgi:CRP-like cAMP-binding protein
MANVLLADADEFDLRAQGFEHRPLTLGERLVRLGDIPTHAYFPIEGVISIISSTDQGQTVEVAAIGREGLATGVGTTATGASIVDLVVQVPGAALQLSANRFRERLDEVPEFRSRWLQYHDMLVSLIAQSAVCNRYHSGRRRLARWLLTLADRAGTDTIPLTHEMAATFVGGDRPRVSVALRSLRERGLVEHRRGQVTIIDREGLSRMSCECYGRVPAPPN